MRLRLPLCQLPGGSIAWTGVAINLVESINNRNFNAPLFDPGRIAAGSMALL